MMSVIVNLGWVNMFERLPYFSIRALSEGNDLMYRRFIAKQRTKDKFNFADVFRQRSDIGGSGKNSVINYQMNENYFHFVVV